MELAYKGHSVRVLMIRGVPWFALSDVGEALGLNECGLDQVNDKAFPAFAKTVATEAVEPEVPGEPEEQVLLSPVGVWYLTTLLCDPGRGQHIANWAKKEAAVLCPNPVPGDPAVFLTILDVDGRKELPPYPWKYSGRRSEYQDLKDSNEWFHAEGENRSLTAQPRRVLNGRPQVPELWGTA